MQGKFVIENVNGDVVRTLNWQGGKLSLVYREDTKRVQPLHSVKELDEQDIPYRILAEVTQDQVTKKPVKIGGSGQLKWVPEVEELSPSIDLQEDDPKKYFVALRWTAAIQTAILIFVFIIAHFATAPVKEEPQIVTIMEKPTEKPQRRPPVVNPVTHKQQPKIVKAITHKKIVQPKIAHAKVLRKSMTHSHSESVNTMGALGVLGSLNKTNHGGGLDVNAVNTTRGPGLGGSAGSGGVQTSIYSRGLVAAPLGAGGHATGAGGYGTHGKGGGQAGYGRMSLVGSSSAYFEPVEREAEVEGGLDREQIAEVIQRHLGQVRYCYEQGLQVKPQLSGRVAVHFLISAAGLVSTANIVNTSLHASEVERCIVGHLRSWRFPQPRGGVIVKVNYPFVLKRVSQS